MNKEIKVGDKATLTKTFTQEEVLQFAKASCDKNPIHFDEKYINKTQFSKPIVQGLLAASILGGLMGSELPGEGTVYLGQTLRFKSPVYIDEKVTAVIEVIKIRQDKPIITFRTVVYKEDETIATEGEAIIIMMNLIRK